MTDTQRTEAAPEWDGPTRNGRPVAHCGECGTLVYADNVEYIGEAALGGPNFSYNLGDPVEAPEPSAGAAPPNVKRLREAMRQYLSAGVTMVNIEQVLSLLDADWPHGNFTAKGTDR